MKIYHLLVALLVPVLVTAQEYTRVPGLPTSLMLVSENSKGLTAAVAQGLYLRLDPDTVFRLVDNTGGPSLPTGIPRHTGVGVSPDRRYVFLSSYRAEGVYRYDTELRKWQNVNPWQLGRNVTAMLVHPVSGSILAGGGRFDATGSAGAAIGLYMSNDNGESWNSVTSPDGDNGSWNHIHAIQPDSANSFVVSVSSRGQQRGLYRVAEDASAYQLATETPNSFVVTRSGAYHLPFSDLMRYVPFSGPDSGTGVTKRDLQGVVHISRWSADSVIAILRNATGKGYWYTFLSNGEPQGGLIPLMDSVDNIGEFTWFSSRKGVDLEFIRIGEGTEHSVRVNSRPRRLRFEPAQPAVSNLVMKSNRILMRVSQHGWVSLSAEGELAHVSGVATSMGEPVEQRADSLDPMLFNSRIVLRVHKDQTADTLLDIDTIEGSSGFVSVVEVASGLWYIATDNALYQYAEVPNELREVTRDGWPLSQDSSLLYPLWYSKIGESDVSWFGDLGADSDLGGMYVLQDGAWVRSPESWYDDRTWLERCYVDTDSALCSSFRYIGGRATSSVVSRLTAGEREAEALSQDIEASPGIRALAWLHSGQPAWSDNYGRLWIKHHSGGADSTTLFGRVIGISPEEGRTTLVTSDSGVYRVTAFRVLTSVADETHLRAEQIVPCMFNGGPVIIYDVLGEQVAILPVIDDAIAPSDLKALPMQPLWAVNGDCVRRVR